jgi:tetratricopeptide (TPR) repeat protein
MDLAAETAQAYQAFARRDYVAAAESARRVLARAPGDPAALTIFGRLALTSHEPDVALGIFEQILKTAPQVAATWVDLAHALAELRRDRDAIAAIERALALNPAYTPGLLKLGETWLALGERDLAATAFRRAIVADPSLAAAYRGLSLAEDIHPGSAIEKKMSEMAQRSQPTPQASALLHYALAQVFRRAGDDERFAHHLLAANEKQRAAIATGDRAGARSEYEAVFDRLEAAFEARTLQGAARAAEISPRPLFVLGMPRSGTTLVEQLLAASPGVVAGGELQFVRGPLRRLVEQATGRQFPEGITDLPVDQLDAIAASFARRLRLVAPEARDVTDKTPDNFHVLGALRLLFPAARIIHVARDPMDTCFSILQHPFDERSAHAYDQELLGYAYARYARLMRHWEQLFPGEFLTVSYEKLVAAPAAEAQRLFAFCGLEWDDAFLDARRSAHAVRTFSVTQVRQPIYRTSVGSWRRHAEALEPLRRSLDEAERESARSG